jgi:DNA-binding response OmpR family regulator
VKRLRAKLRAAGGELAVETVRGVGYRLAAPA